MNILLITNLYPAYKNQSRIEMSYALHDFTVKWAKNNNIIVINQILPRYKNIFSSKPVYPKLDREFVLDAIKIYNFITHKIPMTKILFGTNIIRKLLKSNNFIPDLILAHLYNSYIIANKLSVFYKCNLVLGMHNIDLKHINKRKYAKPLRNCIKISCRSSHIMNEMLKLFPEYEKKIFIANSGINLSDIEKEEYFLEKIDTWKNKSKMVFITIANLIKRKNIDTVLDSLSFFSNNDWEYIIIGDGEEREFLSKKAEQLKINAKVHFLGHKTREEIFAYLKLTDIFVMVSSRETFGLVYLEAMAKGNMIIGCKDFGIDGIIHDGENGFLVEARNAGQLASVIQNIYNSPFEEKKRMLQNIEQTILANTSDIAADNYLRFIYE